MPADEDPGGTSPGTDTGSDPPPFFGLWPRFAEVDERAPLLRDTARVLAQRDVARRERTMYRA